MCGQWQIGICHTFQPIPVSQTEVYGSTYMLQLNNSILRWKFLKINSVYKKENAYFYITHLNNSCSVVKFIIR